MKALTFIIIVIACFQATGQSINRQNPDELTRPGGSELLTAWMDVHLKSIQNCKLPVHHVRQLAYTGIALYESIVGGAKDYKPLSGQLSGYDHTPPVPQNTDICWQASANSAIASVLRYFYTEPVNLQRIDSMEGESQKMFLTRGFSEASVKAGSEYGKKVAMTIIDWSNGDGADKISAPYTAPSGDGYWEPTPPNFTSPVTPYMGNCRTFIKGSIEKTIPPPPPAFSKEKGSEFYKMVHEVYQASLQEEEKNTALALYWDDFPNGKTLTAGGHWESILKTVMKQENLSLIEGARAFAGLYIAMHDAAVGCFKAKYTYNLVRPVTYVQKYIQKDWVPLIPTPSHPEYPAAHATVSMAAATMLTHLLGDKTAFIDNTYAYRNLPQRHYANFKEAGTDAGMSRFYGGIHYKPSIKAGFQQGEKIADNVAHSLQFRNSMAGR